MRRRWCRLPLFHLARRTTRRTSGLCKQSSGQTSVLTGTLARDLASRDSRATRTVPGPRPAAPPAQSNTRCRPAFPPAAMSICSQSPAPSVRPVRLPSRIQRAPRARVLASPRNVEFARSRRVPPAAEAQGRRRHSTVRLKSQRGRMERWGAGWGDIHLDAAYLTSLAWKAQSVQSPRAAPRSAALCAPGRRAWWPPAAGACVSPSRCMDTCMQGGLWCAGAPQRRETAAARADNGTLAPVPGHQCGEARARTSDFHRPLLVRVADPRGENEELELAQVVSGWRLIRRPI
ncbi:hypothetical protein FA95DRAFT_154557 [Auriscalpium vulgare]|uniref:Uncharacterized protein n=1 Tax=Auriscalpium vulgare TaxID=40419 RepID=A0ACB8RMH6_9AGAM|nr:hypothetical protein FA95DRAFT_154557 [Auriscalpium vulgare]